MEVIFLDIDGVLATPISYKVAYKLKNYYGEKWWKYFSFPGLMQPCIDQLNRLHDTGAQIVVSSTWRKGKKKDFIDLQNYLAKCGIKLPVVDRTPIHFRKLSGNKCRDKEIQEWLDLHPDVVDFVIFDDNKLSSNMTEDLKDHFVHIENGWSYLDTEERKWQPGKGLEAHHIDRAKEILKGNI